MKIVIVGTGYVGLVTGTCFAELENDVICVDIDEQKVKAMQAGHIPIYEPGLEEVFNKNINAGRLHFTTNLKEAMQAAEVVFLALPTPSDEDGSADLSYVLNVADQLGPLLQRYTVVVDKSTVPVGTAEKVRQRIAAKTDVAFDVASNPEFLREGFAVQDFMKPSRVVIGVSSDKARKFLEQLYAPLTNDQQPLIFMDERSAELTKYAANSFLAMKITFINQIANLCDLLGANVDDIRKGVGSDERIGHRFLYPGIGYGGSCFPKDVLALMRTSEDAGYQFDLLKSVIERNHDQQALLVKKARRYYKDNLAGKTFALWGLAFKPDTDDIRESAALTILTALTDAGAKVRAYDPEAMDTVRSKLKDNQSLALVASAEEALEGADALFIATEWPEFANASVDKIKELLGSPVVFDGRNLFDPQTMRTAGLYYESIGRPTAKP